MERERSAVTPDGRAPAPARSAPRSSAKTMSLLARFLSRSRGGGATRGGLFRRSAAARGAAHISRARAAGRSLLLPLRRPLTTSTATSSPPRPRWKTFTRWFIVFPYSLLAIVPTGTALAWLHARVVDPENVARRRHWGFFTWTGVVAFLWGPTVPGFAPFVRALDWDHRRYYDWLLRHWARTTTAPYFQPVIEGGEKLPALWAGGDGDGVVFVCNHQSWMDIYTLAWLPIELNFVCKREIAYIPLCGW